MLDKDHNGLNAKKGLLIFFICLMLSATAMITNYLPFKTQSDYNAKCTVKTTAKVFSDDDPYLDGNLYFGPMLEYSCPERGQLVHAEAASAVRITGRYKIGDEVNIAYDPGSPGELYIISDTETLESHWKLAWGFGIGIAVFGFIMMLIGCIRSMIGTDKELSARKFIKTPDGKTYNEWLDEQKKKMEQKALEEKESEE